MLMCGILHAWYGPWVFDQQLPAVHVGRVVRWVPDNFIHPPVGHEESHQVFLKFADLIPVH